MQFFLDYGLVLVGLRHTVVHGSLPAAACTVVQNAECQWNGSWTFGAQKVYIEAATSRPRQSSSAEVTSSLTCHTGNLGVCSKSAGVCWRLDFMSFSVSLEVVLAANETRTITFAPANYTALHVRSPVLWWPWQMGAQPMHNLSVWFSAAAPAAGSAPACQADVLRTRFAIRQVSSELDKNAHRLFRVNARPLLIRGGGPTGTAIGYYRAALAFRPPPPPPPARGGGAALAHEALLLG